jgi:hypothetical protein
VRRAEDGAAAGVTAVRDVQRLHSEAEVYEEQIHRLEAQLLGARDEVRLG